MKKKQHLYKVTITFLVIITGSIIFSGKINAQKMDPKKIEFPKSFMLGKQDFLKSNIFISPKVLVEYGVNVDKNPVVIKEKSKMQSLAKDFNKEDINQLYVELYANSASPKQESAHIVVVEFKSLEQLNMNMRVVDKVGLYYPSYFTIDKYVIILGCEDRKLLEGIANFYAQKLGAKYYYPKSN